jgi:hypothetical protein
MIPMPRNNPLRHLPVAEWPPADRRLWERVGSSDDPFADVPGARLAKTTRRTYLFGWRRFLGFLAIHEPDALAIAPSDRLTIKRVHAFATHLAKTCKARSIAKGVDTLFQAARMLMPEKDWTWLKTLKGRLYAVAPAHTSAKPIIISPQLLELGEKLMDESKPDPGAAISRHDAVRFRDGLLFAFTVFIPPRRKNLAELEINRHLRRLVCGHPGRGDEDGNPHRVRSSRTTEILSRCLSDHRSSKAASWPEQCCAVAEFLGAAPVLQHGRPNLQPAFTELFWIPHCSARRARRRSHDLGHRSARPNRRRPRLAHSS